MDLFEKFNKYILAKGMAKEMNIVFSVMTCSRPTDIIEKAWKISKEG